jgi:hypothetical protein
MATTTTRRRRPQPKQEAAPKTTAVKTVRETKAHTADLTDAGTETERNFERLLSKDPNGTHQEFVQWFEDMTGVTLDVKTVQYTLATYAEFQRSPEHRKVTQQRRQAAAERKAQAEKNRVERARQAAERAGLKIAS